MSDSFALDGSYRRHQRVVIAGSPLRLFRLSAAGQRVVEAIELDQPLPANHAHVDRSSRRRRSHPSGPHRLTVHRCRCHDRRAGVQQPARAWPACTATSIVVDDGSEPPLGPRTRTAHHSAGDQPRPRRGAQRRAGRGDHPARRLRRHRRRSDRRLAGTHCCRTSATRSSRLVAPRVRRRDGHDAARRSTSRRDRRSTSGTEQGRIAAGTRISYVPAAALVVRTDALRGIGGFDETLRTGEDVDMVWRLIDAGHRCRYEPASTVHHRPRIDAVGVGPAAVLLRSIGGGTGSSTPGRRRAAADERMERSRVGAGAGSATGRRG